MDAFDILSLLTQRKQDMKVKLPEFVMNIFYRDDQKPVSIHSASLVSIKSSAREEVKWENCARVVIVTDEGQIIFDQVGDFVE